LLVFVITKYCNLPCICWYPSSERWCGGCVWLWYPSKCRGDWG